MKRIIKFIGILLVATLFIWSFTPNEKASAFTDEYQGYTSGGLKVYKTTWNYKENLTKQWIADVTKLNYPYINTVYNEFWYNGNSTSGVQVTYAYNPKGWSVYLSASIIW
ncbi:hypothetical protein AFR91_10280 [Listeria monocytogenes]|nr:hypothetical protein [Listeria monocytogenes]EAC7277863.1 hypothetical protein [Listeria monocytogenes]EAD3582466.1 hypothetical protein [Listeria monocytogenes]EAD9747582.1 hypothetical protein [Listeria monocytogenes]EAD9857636.1 hypothetical protein [Listeria monocytogenes]